LSESSKETSLQINFSSFVVGLATSAMAAMGDGPAGSKPDLKLAQQTIDVLALLKEKTANNLDEEEGKLLEALLYETRMRFVEKSGR
jgi:hypothetical protein